MSLHSEFSIRNADRDDAKAVRMLLSSPNDAFETQLVAVCGNPSRIVAAGGLTKSERPKPLVGPGIVLQVIESARSRGIGKALLQRLVDRAMQRGAEAVYATQKVATDSWEKRAWEALGFSACETVEYHELPLEEFEKQLAPLYDRMHQRGKIPISARVHHLYEADLVEVAKLHLAELGGDLSSLMKKLSGEVPGSFAPWYSRVLTFDDRIVGCILAHRKSHDIIHVDANIISPEVRGRWANVMLKLEATRGAAERGVKKFVFTTFDHYTDTRSFTARMRGETVRKQVLMYLPLKSSSETVAEVE
ncbi:GNAT family N-acetyltransferase [Bythopirellula goksoeyrii]|uniref:N-acetylglutamate synthase n=1 Tax=Bythopirellula goksoeyrii TaxID=1400387 RepID=A0A5B9QR02_9BACT|nr:GNAT family N-acetyltransferase [Bythopirellula goksoeyrii]QEG36403.1 N-acetylglutamate synthase [Bythopirellula goksoeyrii]